jgi:hypothetical protein
MEKNDKQSVLGGKIGQFGLVSGVTGRFSLGKGKLTLFDFGTGRILAMVIRGKRRIRVWCRPDEVERGQVQRYCSKDTLSQEFQSRGCFGRKYNQRYINF